jgi:hypothetical protein
MQQVAPGGQHLETAGAALDSAAVALEGAAGGGMADGGWRLGQIRRELSRALQRRTRSRVAGVMRAVAMWLLPARKRACERVFCPARQRRRILAEVAQA